MSFNKPDWKDAPSWATVLLKNVTDPNLYAFAEKYCEGERFTRSDDNFKIVYKYLLPVHWDVIETRQGASQTSKYKTGGDDMSEQSKFKVGDKVRFLASTYEPDISRGAILDVVGNGVLGSFTIVPNAVWVGYADTYPEEFELVEESPQTSNDKSPYVSFFTSVIVAKNKAVSDIGELLYDENTTKIYLEDDGGGAFLVVEQDYNGAIQQIRLDIDEVDSVFSAIKQLVNQMETK